MTRNCTNLTYKFWSIGYSVVFIFLGCIHSNAQRDTVVNISEVTIVETLKPKLTIVPYLSADLQHQNANLYIRNYGIGQLSTFSIRGCPPENTDVRWMNVSISSPMNQHIDLSLIINSLGQSLELSENMMHRGNGGMLSMVNKPLDSVSWIADIQLYSTQWLAQRLYLIQKYNKWSWNLSHTSHFGPNLYQYKDQINQLHTIAHNQNTTLDTKFSALWYINQHKFGFHIWNLYSFRQIPPAIGSNIQYESLMDHHLRALLQWQYDKFTITSSVHSEAQNYQNPSINLDANHRSLSIRNSLDWTIPLSSHFRLGYQHHHSLYRLNSSNYSSTLNFYDHFHTLYLRYVAPFWSAQFGLKQLGNSHLQSHPMPNLNINTSLDRFMIGLALGMDTRLPTTNELYWSPGGNPRLLNERSIHAKMSFKRSFQYFDLDITPYFIRIYDGIRWLPSASPAIWSPINVNQIENLGTTIDLNSNWNIKSHNVIISNHQQLHLIRSRWNQTTTQIYTPGFKWVYNIDASWRKFSIRLSSNYTSSRYILTDNSEWLHPYLMMNAQIKYQLNVQKKYQIILGLTAHNMLNTSYVEIANRPMPLRYYSLQFSIQQSK